MQMMQVHDMNNVHMQMSTTIPATVNGQKRSALKVSPLNHICNHLPNALRLLCVDGRRFSIDARGMLSQVLHKSCAVITNNPRTGTT